MTGPRLGAVLAGGASSRFGSDKALATVDGIALLDRARGALAPHVGLVVVVGRAGGVPDAPAPGMGPLGGIAGALDHARQHGFASVLTIGCDLPDVPATLLAALTAVPLAYCPAAPIVGHWPAALADGLIDYLAPFAGAEGKAAELSVRRWAQMVGAVAVASPYPLANVNTPADLPR